MNLKIKILIGIPASGKTTWTNNFLRNNQDYVRVSRDHYRYMLRNEGDCSPKIEAMITELQNEAIYRALYKKLNVIVDNTNVRVRHINELINEFKYSADIDYQVFDISLDKAIERDNNRERKVGEVIIKRMYEDYKILIDSFHFQPVPKEKRKAIVPNFKSDLPNAVAFDLDGTLALMNYNRGPFDWNSVDRDSVNEIVKEHVLFHKNAGRVIIILSGRDSASMDLTKEWLDFYEIPYDYIFMRAKDDMRKDNIVKKELYENHIKDKFNLLAVYDDRLQVLNMWYNVGIFTFNVNQGNILF